MQSNSKGHARSVKTDAAPADSAQTGLQELIRDKYKVIQPLGKGSQGAVYLAESIETHQKVAIKQLNIQSVKDWKQYDLFQREADVLKRLDIPGVAKLHETIERLDAETPMAFIVQDYIHGDPMQKFISNGHRFQINQIGGILLQLLDILQKLHQSDPVIVHRDIKPSNILLNYQENNSTPEVHLIDFGAVSNPQVKGGGSTVVGTYGYMAPEQLMGRACAASDIYSLAIVTVYLLSGIAPENLEIQDYHVLIDKPLQHLPYQITAFLRQMLEPSADDRMTDYDKIRNFYKALIDQKFDEIPLDSYSPKKHQYTLKNVYSYHQPGNIVLWQELSKKPPNTRYSYLNKIVFFFSLVCFFLIFVLSMYIIFHYSPDSTTGTIGFIVIFLFPLVLLAIQISETIKKLQIHRSMIYFFKHARKSMATVIRIEYIPLYHPGINLNKKYIPTWKIIYSFNPPDDKSPDNLIRSVETHVEPDVKEGDLIPILYLIHKGKSGEFVYSAPYPIPVTDEFKLSKDYS